MMKLFRRLGFLANHYHVIKKWAMISLPGTMYVLYKGKDEEHTFYF